jgi:hypothetical protein
MRALTARQPPATALARPELGPAMRDLLRSALAEASSVSDEAENRRVSHGERV